ncbi:MAG: hypothetical protein LH478_10300 [Chitinophagaceae bacterium]|nr:hypothetical protein [Chitinophagaceae bacterium]
MLSKLYGTLLSILLLTACANNRSDKTDQQTDSTSLTADSTPPVKVDTVVIDGAVLSFARDSILQLMEAKQYAGLSRFIGDEGILFSPFGSADTTKNKVLSRLQFLELLKNNTQVLWGYADGTGDAIRLTIPQYFKKYVYDVAFLKAEQTSVNKVIDPDSAISKVPSVYANNSFVQFYFPGFNEDYEGLDWKSLLLVFKQQQSKYYLVAVIHNKWKI